ncbi:DNA polymerase type-X family protein pol4 [Tolypocladium paradoxum]|uniref:DNA-directed DNA polymerase n=1 Tax=Tolypocladium paradoxum TaxID=94208 RepID=A0A2S4KTA9_9HYPO|nr:DNA polymerase type-X family protein pol4 [Tolypocladium paradoxum]
MPPVDFPAIFLLPTHLQPAELHRLEDSIPSLTYDIREAELILGKISRTERAQFELRRLRLETEPIRDGGGSGHAEAVAREPAAASVVSRQDSAPSPKRHRLSTPGVAHGPADAGPVGFPGTGSSADSVKVLKLSWLTDCLEQGALLPVQEYLLYQGRKIPSNSSPNPRKKHAPASAMAGILRRAAVDQQASGGKPVSPSSSRNTSGGASLGHSLAHPPPALVRESTSEHEVPLHPVPDYLHTTYSCQRPTLVNPPNAAFIDGLKNIRTLRLLQGDQIGVRAYSTSIATLSAYPYTLQGPQELARLPGCGAKLAELYQQWQETGQTKEIVDAGSEPKMAVLQLFYDIWGVGDATAREFYNKGWRDLDDVVEYGWASLSRVQQIGVKYYDEFQLKIPRQEVEAIAGVILSHARKADAGFELAIVGGYRRGKKASGDVDVVLSHRDESKTLNLIDKVVLGLEKGGFITHTLSLWTRNSERGQMPLPWQGEGSGRGTGFDTLDKAMVVWQGDGDGAPHRRVDIIVSPWKTVGCALLGWSGETTFQRDLRRYCKREKGLKFDSSGIRRRANGEWVDLEGGGGGGGAGPDRGPAPDMETAEKRVFEGLGLPWRRPEERCTGVLVAPKAVRLGIGGVFVLARRRDCLGRGLAACRVVSCRVVSCRGLRPRPNRGCVSWGAWVADDPGQPGLRGSQPPSPAWRRSRCVRRHKSTHGCSYVADIKSLLVPLRLVFVLQQSSHDWPTLARRQVPPPRGPATSKRPTPPAALVANMPFILELPDQYGLVLAAATTTFFVNTIHVLYTTKFRKASGVKYPNAYASAEQADKDPNAYLFNCAQRAHANFTENHTSFLGALLIAGLRFPFPAAVLGAGWSLSRLLYLFGYTSSAGPRGRTTGALGANVTDFILKLTAAYASVMFVLGE